MDSLEAIGRNGTRTEQFRNMLFTLQGVTALALIAAMFLEDRPAALLIGGATTLIIFQFIVSRILGVRSGTRVEAQKQIAEESRETRRQVEELFNMTDMLQSANSHEDAGAVLEAASRKLLPEFSGALYVFNNSRDRLDLSRSWSDDEKFDPADSILPSNCWALKRGKMHVNDTQTGSLCCMHHLPDSAIIEVPMLARGAINGLLMFGCPEGSDSAEQRKLISRTSRALADSVSLALSNIALREKLRTQSLRDPLTGLYNRRYMEDTLERYLSLSERTGEATSAIMLDLDHFKLLNDKHGHAKGDAVLRDVASQLVGALRPSDVVCRYGGEEILALLPSCDLEAAADRAETLRRKVEVLGEVHDTKISASFGVACVPETSNGASDLIAMADAALYRAKREGRNCVRIAVTRRGKGEDNEAQKKDDPAPRLAVG